MGIPPSAIILPLILAVPFGFAIRDSVKGNDAASHEAKAQKELADLEAREHDQQIAAERDQYEREKKLEKARAAVLGSLIGATPATLGSAFGGKQLDSSTIEVDHAVDELVRDHAGVTGLDGKLVSFALTIEGDQCPALRALLSTKWGDGTSVTSDEELVVWPDPANHRRAAIRSVNMACVLDFTRTVDDAAWVDAALPKLFGKTLPQAEKLLGALTNPDMPSWYSAGLPVGRDATTLSVEIEGTKITGTNANANVAQDDAAAIIKLVTKRFGQPVHDSADEWSWNDGKVTLTYYAPVLNLFHQP